MPGQITIAPARPSYSAVKSAVRAERKEFKKLIKEEEIGIAASTAGFSFIGGVVGGITGMAWSLVHNILGGHIGQGNVAESLERIGLGLAGGVGLGLVGALATHVFEYFSRPAKFEIFHLAMTSLDPALLNEFASGRYNYLKVGVARNPNCPEPILGELINAQNQAGSVKKAIADNPVVKNLVFRARNSTSPQELTNLSKKPFPCVRGALAENPNAPAGILSDIIQTDPKWKVKYAAARNSNAPWGSVADFLSQLKEDPYIGEGVVSYDSVIIDTVYCHDGQHDIYDSVPIYGPTTLFGFVGESLEIARQVLENHRADQRLIAERLKEIKPTLWEALMNKRLIDIS